MSFSTSVVSGSSNPIKDFIFGLFSGPKISKTSTSVTVIGGKKKVW